MTVNNNKISTCTSPEKIFLKEDKNYGQLLSFYGLKYEPVDYYLQVGEIDLVQGWILHISVVTSQVEDMFKTVIPSLTEENVSFKIAMTKQVCNDLLSGDLGIAQIGKLVSVYPKDYHHAFSLAKKLISLTEKFKGPHIPTDILLGNVVYTRYGSFNPILIPDINGREEKYIYDHTGQLVKDVYSIPFSLPVGVEWPFGELASNFISEPSKVLKQIYRPISILKEDVKGNVFKAIYLKGIFKVKKCVIKQGFQNMSSEDSGRDIHDRLAWQQELHNDLSDTIPLPKIIDFFREEGNSFLVMDFIQGKSLFDKIREINPDEKSWFHLKPKSALLILDYVINIIQIIGKLHQKGYVHRDIASPNFMINNKGRLFLIDMELAYSLFKHRPNPPFEYGTLGFMSPEQQAVLQPTTKEDIYGLGALMLEIFTGLTPIKIDTYNYDTLFENINFFIAHSEISHTIKSCLHPYPQYRPELKDIQNVIIKYKQELTSQTVPPVKQPIKAKCDISTLQQVINSALEGINRPPTMVLNNLWYSKMVNVSNLTISRHKEYTRYTGIAQGIGGVLYLLARAKKAGFNIGDCIKSYNKGWNFINEQYSEAPQNVSPGLYTGSAGVALALKEGMDAGIINNTASNIIMLKKWVSPPNSIIDFANGVAGQGVSLLQCASYLDSPFMEMMLNQYCNILLESQQKNGSWLFPPLPNGTEEKLMFTFGYGIPGILWFLLEYGWSHQKNDILITAKKALQQLLRSHKFSKKYMTRLFLKSSEKQSYYEADKWKGILITLFKAYEIFKEENYRTVAEKILLQYPHCIVNNNFTQKNGIAGLGELYLEAANIFHNEEWKIRADWIANLYIHTFKRNPDGSGYWKLEERNAPTADFMTGTTGIIHFLLRCYNLNQLGFRFLK